MDSPTGAIYITNLLHSSSKDSIRPFFVRFGSIHQGVVRQKCQSASALILLFKKNLLVQPYVKQITLFSRPTRVRRAFVHPDFSPSSRSVSFSARERSSNTEREVTMHCIRAIYQA
jgi:hypothetical protein